MGFGFFGKIIGFSGYRVTGMFWVSGAVFVCIEALVGVLHGLLNLWLFTAHVIRSIGRRFAQCFFPEFTGFFRV